jgi:hypothetical protein
MRAYCWRGGVIGFARVPPKGTIPFASGPARKLRSVIAALARHAYDGKTLLVPGIPEEKKDGKALDALEAFSARVAVALARAKGTP